MSTVTKQLDKMVAGAEDITRAVDDLYNSQLDFEAAWENLGIDGFINDSNAIALWEDALKAAARLEQVIIPRKKGALSQKMQKLNLAYFPILLS